MGNRGFATWLIRNTCSISRPNSHLASHLLVQSISSTQRLNRECKISPIKESQSSVEKRTVSYRSIDTCTITAGVQEWKITELPSTWPWKEAASTPASVFPREKVKLFCSLRHSPADSGSTETKAVIILLLRNSFDFAVVVGPPVVVDMIKVRKLAKNNLEVWKTIRLQKK